MIANRKLDKETRAHILRYYQTETRSVEVPDWTLDPADFYLGNIMIRKVNIPHEYSNLQLAEYFKCQKDPIYFIEKYIKIVSIDDGLVPFKLYDYQREMIEGYKNNRFNISLTARQMGKSVCLDTPLPTPTGWTTIGEVKIGDKIMDRDGKPTTVTFKSEIHHKDTYEITFDNGEKVKACKDHLWTVSCTDWQRYGKKERTLTTLEVIELQNKLQKRSKPARVFINAGQPLQLPEQELELDPYTLGVWLGDGDSNQGKVTGTIEDLNDITSCIPYSVKSRIRDKRKENTHRYLFEGLTTKLREIGVLKAKHIPQKYLRGSLEQRIELLRGLMDTDGHCEKNGRCEFYQKDNVLLEGVRELLSTLGIKFKERFKEIDGVRYYTLSFCTELKVFKLARKLARQEKCKHHPKNTRFYITDIVQIETIPTQCIQVDNPDHLFLCGKTMIPTHNTTTVAAFLLWFSLFHPDKTVAVLANKRAQAMEIMDRVHTMYEHLPFFLQGGVTVHNKGTIQFGNRSKLFAAATSSSSIRGQSISLLYLDELAFVADDYAFYESTYPVVTAGKKSRVLITSTPNGAKGLFHKLWHESLEGNNDYHRIEVQWFRHPERDQEWAANTKRNLASDSQWLQEFCCKFIGSSGTLIDATKLQDMFFKNPINAAENYSIYEEPINGHVYAMTVDTAHGVGQDYSAFVVFDVTDIPYKVVAKYRDNKISPMIFPSFIHQAGMHYNDAMILVENNDIGAQTGNLLYSDLENENVIWCAPNGRNGQQIDDGSMPNSRVGLKQTVATKGTGCANLKTLIEEDKLLVYDNDIINELGTFIAKGKSYEADDGCNDDLAMCLVMFSWLSSQSYFKEMTDMDARERILQDREEQMIEELTPWGLIQDGTEHKIEIDSDGTVWTGSAVNDDPVDRDFMEENWGTTNGYDQF